MLTYDPNNKFVGDANPNKVETISKEVFFHYNPFGEKCLTCLLWMEVKTPACIFECNYFIHPRSSNEAPIIECRCSSKDPLSVYLSRYNLSYDFNYNISYIFRSCKNNNTRIHHFNQNPYDDRKRNLGACSGQEHAGMHDNDINKIIGPMIVKTASFIYQLKIDIVNVLKKSKVKEKIKIKNTYFNLFLTLDLNREKIEELIGIDSDLTILNFLYDYLDTQRRQLKSLISKITQVDESYTTEYALKIIEEEQNECSRVQSL